MNQQPVPVQHNPLDVLPGGRQITEHEYLVSLCARHVGQPFLDERLVDVVIQSLTWAKKKFKWHLYCYCVMPDHLHFVCRLTVGVKAGRATRRPRKSEGILDHLAKLKSSTTNAAWRLGIEGRLFKKSDCERLIDIGKPFDQIIQHVLNNPVRRGLVNEWSGWPHSKIVDRW